MKVMVMSLLLSPCLLGNISKKPNLFVCAAASWGGTQLQLPYKMLHTAGENYSHGSTVSGLASKILSTRPDEIFVAILKETLMFGNRPSSVTF